MRYDNLNITDHELYFVGTSKYAKDFSVETRKNFKSFLVVEDMNFETISLLIELIGGVDKIICFSEEDLYLAAALRERYQVPGTTTSQIRPFRDKYLMKLRVSSAGLPTPKFGLIRALGHTPFEIFECARKQYGLPFVLKPRLGMANQGIFIVSNRLDFQNVCEELQCEFSTYMIESYVVGEMYHVDSFYFNSELRMYASQYTVPQIQARYGPTGSITLPEDSDDANELFALNQQVLTALVLPPGCAHAEYFKSQTGSFIFCEVGARIGGTQVIPMLERVHGINLAQIWFTAETGLTYRPEATARFPVGGFVDFPIQAKARLDTIDLNPTVPDTELIESRLEVGYISGDQTLEQNRAASFFVGGSTQDEVQARINQLIERRPLRWSAL